MEKKTVRSKKKLLNLHDYLFQKYNIKQNAKLKTFKDGEKSNLDVRQSSNYLYIDSFFEVGRPTGIKEMKYFLALC